MHHLLYQTECVVTGRFYVGVHSTDDLDDGYLGSGLVVVASVAKYGVDQHIRTIIGMFSTRSDALRAEAIVVTDALVRDPLCMNLKQGGEGGWPAAARGWKPSVTKLGNIAANEARAWRMINDDAWRASELERMVRMTELAKSEQATLKRRETFDRIAHGKGANNSQFGTCWIVRDAAPIKIKLELLEEYLSKGYRRGRK